MGRVREALRQEGVSAEMVEVEIKDAAAAQLLGFPGSPTIRINGQDVEHPARAFGLACRTYDDQGQRTGVPPLKWIRAAMREAKEK